MSKLCHSSFIGLYNKNQAMDFTAVEALSSLYAHKQQRHSRPNVTKKQEIAKSIKRPYTLARTVFPMLELDVYTCRSYFKQQELDGTWQNAYLCHTTLKLALCLYRRAADIGMKFPELWHNWFSQCHFHFSYHSTTGLLINIARCPSYVPDH